MSTPNQSGNPIQREEKGTASIDPGTTKNCGPSGEMTLAGSGAQSITPIKPLEGVSSLPGKSASNPTTPRTRTRRSSSYSVPSSSQQGQEHEAMSSSMEMAMGGIIEGGAAMGLERGSVAGSETNGHAGVLTPGSKRSRKKTSKQMQLDQASSGPKTPRKKSETPIKRRSTPKSSEKEPPIHKPQKKAFYSLLRAEGIKHSETWRQKWGSQISEEIDDDDSSSASSGSEPECRFSSDSDIDDSFIFDEFLQPEVFSDDFEDQISLKSKSQTEEQALLRRKKRLKKLRKMYEAQFYRLRDSLRTKHRIFVTKRNEALLESGCPRLDKQKKKKKDAEDEEDIEMETIPLDGEVGPTTNRSEEAHVPRSSNEEKKSTTEDLKSKRIATEDERKREQKLASCAKKRRFLQSHFQQNPSPYAWELHQLCGRSGLSGDYERMYVPCVIGNNSKYFVKQSVAGSRKKKQRVFSCGYPDCLSSRLPSTKYCKTHILNATDQTLFRPCDYTSPLTQKTCGQPVLAVIVPPRCTEHTNLPPLTPSVHQPVTRPQRSRNRGASSSSSTSSSSSISSSSSSSSLLLSGSSPFLVGQSASPASTPLNGSGVPGSRSPSVSPKIPKKISRPNRSLPQTKGS